MQEVCDMPMEHLAAAELPFIRLSTEGNLNPILLLNAFRFLGWGDSLESPLLVGRLLTPRQMLSPAREHHIADSR